MKTDRKAEIIKVYMKMIKKSDHVSLQNLQNNGVTKDMIKHSFGSLSELDKASRLAFPNSFSSVHVESLYSRKALEDLRNIVTTKKRLVITTAVSGSSIHSNFYKSLQLYCKLNDAQLLILVASDPANNMYTRAKWGTIPTELATETIVMEDTLINENLFISTIKMSAKQVDPTTGLGRVSQRNGSCIFASPKQRLKAIPVGNHAYPRFMMGTGAITVPNYNTESYMSMRTAYIAEHDHVMGGIVVEIVDDKHFHFRHFQADKKGNFIDLGTQYCPNFTKIVRPEAFVFGDWHSGETDPQARQAWDEVIDTLKPKSIVFHDLFNGLSINHHEEGNFILKAQRAEKGELSLDNELVGVAFDLEHFIDKVDSIVVVKSNHDLFLSRYLQEAKYVKDPHNHRLALELAIKLLDGQDPLRSGVKMFWDSEKDFNKIKWLRQDEDYKIAGVQLASHGHQGSNGAKGTSETLEASLGNSIVGHSHTPEILRNLYRVGTSTKYNLSYNIGGASSWMHTSCVLYADGSRQLINEIGGKWRL